jgi:AraC-like DNA-binding protein
MSSTSIRVVAPALRPFVTGLHYIESDGPPTIERILPSGRVHLMVNLHEDEFRTYHGGDCATIRRTRGAVLEGASSRSRVIDMGLACALVSVDFTLGGAAAFFRTPLFEANDALVELEDLWGTDGSTIRERLLEVPSPEERLRVLERLLLQRHVGRSEPDHAITLAASLFDRGMSVAEVASHVGLSAKTLVRRFRASVGLTPKRFSRVRRLQRVVGSICDTPDADWCDVAAVHGYVDQAHLVHDFRELADMTPTAYQPRSAEEHNHVPVGPG